MMHQKVLLYVASAVFALFSQARAFTSSRDVLQRPSSGRMVSSSSLLHQHAQATTRGHYWSDSSSSSSSNDDSSDDDDYNNNASIMIRDMLWRMTGFFRSMVDERRRFYYLCLPQSGERLHGQSPIRELGSAWDATTALLFWKQQYQEGVVSDEQQRERERWLGDAVCSTLNAYSSCYISAWRRTDQQPQQEHAAKQQGVALSPDVLVEPTNIAHSAFCLLAAANALRLSLFDDAIAVDGHHQHQQHHNDKVLRQSSIVVPPLDGLTRGILYMQRDDGAFRIEFGSDEVYKGIAFYPGEAMVALMDVYQLSSSSSSLSNILEDETRQAILPAMKRAFDFYSDFYRRGDVDANYSIWQVQAFTRLFNVLDQSEEQNNNDDKKNQATLVANYVLDLCQDIIKSRSWKELARGPSFYPNLQTVEIACGLDALAQGILVALDVSQFELGKLFWTHVERAVDFLKAAQDQVPDDDCSAIGSGGIGYGGVQVLEQRLDVTGHAMSALIKVHEARRRWTSASTSHHSLKT